MNSNRKIELCLASAHFFPTHGGAQLRFLRYLPGLRKRGVHARVLTGTPKTKKAFDSDLTEKSHRFQLGEVASRDLIAGALIHRVSLPDKAGWRRSIVFNQAILHFCRQPGYRPDVLQVVSSLQPRSVPWLIRLRQRRIPIIYAYTIPVTLPSHPLRRALRRWSWRRVYDQVDCVIVASTVMRDHARDLGVKKRIEVIPNGVDLQRFQPAAGDAERRALRASLGIGDNGRMITTVGAIHPRKGSDLLLEAWVRLAKRFPDAHLVLVGLRKDLTYPNLSEFRRRLETLIADSGASQRVHFPGLVRNIEDYLRASDLFAFPSLREGMPNVVLEAMASGLPVILTPFIGLSADFGKPESEYLLVERDPDAFAAAIAKVLENDGLRIALGDRGRSWVKDTMDVERSLDRYAELYRQVVDQVQGGFGSKTGG